jgi:hypothetical protein
MTAQEVFNAAVEGIIAQGGPGYDSETGKCEYISDSTGRRCAVGVLLLHGEAKAAQAINSPVTDLLEQGLLPERLAPFVDLLGRLQDAHDRAAEGDPEVFMRSFKRRVAEVARCSALELPACAR